MLSTVPLRSVSVAWTNRISPDPARTSGPSSFWGESKRKMNDREMRWLRLTAREERSRQSWCGMTQSSPSCREHRPLLLPVFFSPLFFFFLASTTSKRLPALPVLHQFLWWWRKSQACVPSEHQPCNTSLATARNTSQTVICPLSASHPPRSPAADHFLYVAPNLAEQWTAFSHICLSDCTTQDKGGGGVGGGRFLYFSSAVLGIHLQGAATAISGSYLWIWFHIWLTHSEL